VKFGFVGASYPTRSVIAEGQRCINLYPEVVESQAGKNQVVLYGTPGLELWTTLGDSPVRGLFYSDENGGRLLAAAGSTLYDVDLNGTATSLGSISDGIYPNGEDIVHIAYNGTQYMIVSDNDGYILSGTTLTKITDADFPSADNVVFLDGYFVIHPPGTQYIYISGLYDGTSWNALDFTAAESSPDELISIFATHAELWLYGNERTEVYYNTGNADFPFERIAGAIIEQGIDAAESVAKVGSTHMWMGGSQRGRGLVFRADGYNPTRVSTHAVEAQINSYSVVSDAVGWAYQEEGHEFYVLSFPTEQKTWCVSYLHALVTSSHAEPLYKLSLFVVEL